MCETLTDTDWNNIKTKQLESDEQEVYNTYGYYIPKDIKKLTTFPWVWVKTAKVVLHVLYKLPVIAVDTHVHRVSNRIWLVKTETPDATDKVLEAAIPDTYLQIAHHSMILFGRYHCKAQKPQCEDCPFTWFCRYYKQNSSTETL